MLFEIIILKAKATIYSDSEISINLWSNKQYKDPYLPLKIEYEHLIESKKLTITLKKVKGHVDEGNIEVAETNLQKKDVLRGHL